MRTSLIKSLVIIALSIYNLNGQVYEFVVQTDTPTISILPGQTTPRGSTITPGKPVMGSTKGTGMGKIV